MASSPLIFPYSLMCILFIRTKGFAWPPFPPGRSHWLNLSSKNEKTTDANLLVYFLQETDWPADSWDIAHSVVRMMQSSNPFLISPCVHFWLTGHHCSDCEYTHQSSKESLIAGQLNLTEKTFLLSSRGLLHFFLTGRDAQVYVGCLSGTLPLLLGI